MKAIFFCIAIVFLSFSVIPAVVSSRLPAFLIGFALLALMAILIGLIYSVILKILDKENEK